MAARKLILNNVDETKWHVTDQGRGAVVTLIEYGTWDSKTKKSSADKVVELHVCTDLIGELADIAGRMLQKQRQFTALLATTLAEAAESE